VCICSEHRIQEQQYFSNAGGDDDFERFSGNIAPPDRSTWNSVKPSPRPLQKYSEQMLVDA